MDETDAHLIRSFVRTLDRADVSIRLVARFTMTDAEIHADDKLIEAIQEHFRERLTEIEQTKQLQKLQ